MGARRSCGQFFDEVCVGTPNEGTNCGTANTAGSSLVAWTLDSWGDTALRQRVGDMADISMVIEGKATGGKSVGCKDDFFS